MRREWDWDQTRVAAADLLLGAACAGCGAAAWGVCRSCRSRLTARSPEVVRPDPCPPDFPRTVASSPYDPLVRRLVNAHKERQALMLTNLLGERLALSLHTLLASDGWGGEASGSGGRPVLLVPVPSATAAVRSRGFDATLALARSARRRLAGSWVVEVRRVLRQRPGIADQAGLDAAARRRNLESAFVVRRLPPGSTVVLVDDVVTTGSSLAEAARTLERAGAQVLGAATVAATRRRHRSSGPPDGR